MEISSLPSRPGAYLFKDRKGNVLYVGKAKNLKARVRSYFSGKPDPVKREMVKRARDVETVIVQNEQEALALEASLIQQHTPPYNVRLLDDSSYLYIKITNETYPRIELVRTVLPDDAWYRGPFPHAGAARQTLKTARRFFPWCAYRDPSRSKGKPCFGYHIGLCPGICVGAITIEEYQENIAQLQQFLDGNIQDVLRALTNAMEIQSKKQAYERASELRDRIQAIKKTMTPQVMVTPRKESADIIGTARKHSHTAVAVLRMREGRVLGTNVFHLTHPSKEQDEEILRGFLVQYVQQSKEKLPSIFLPRAVEDESVQHSVSLVVPKRGWKHQLRKTADINAKQALLRKFSDHETPAHGSAALRELARILRLPEPPQRIEAYDISNIQGSLATASLVVFEQGMPSRKQYRKFRVTSYDTPNDVGMMEEVLLRRFAHQSKTDRETTWPIPHLIILDGGKGQLNAGIRALQERNVSIPVVSLAKREEELFVPGRRDPITFSPTSPVLFLLQRIRDEAHRFTLGYHQLLRKKRMTHSVLEEIPGIGPATRKKLLRTFGSLAGIKSGSEQELEAVIGKKKARLLRQILNAE